MKKIIVLSILLLACSATLSMTLAECRQHTLNLINRHYEDRRNCIDNTSKKDYTDMPRCFMVATMVIAENSCFPAFTATAKIQNFLWQLEYSNAKNFMDGKISWENYLSNYKRNMDSIRNEEKAGQEMSIQENERMGRAEADAYANVKLNNIINALGGLAQKNKENSGFTTYLINGVSITCSTLGTLISCN